MEVAGLTLIKSERFRRRWVPSQQGAVRALFRHGAQSWRVVRSEIGWGQRNSLPCILERHGSGWETFPNRRRPSDGFDWVGGQSSHESGTKCGSYKSAVTEKDVEYLRNLPCGADFELWLVTFLHFPLFYFSTSSILLLDLFLALYQYFSSISR